VKKCFQHDQDNAITFEACIHLCNNLQIQKGINHQKEVLQKQDHLNTKIGLSKLKIGRSGGIRKDGDNVKSLEA
jgi:hypothetical protein